MACSDTILRRMHCVECIADAGELRPELFADDRLVKSFVKLGLHSCNGPEKHDVGVLVFCMDIDAGVAAVCY